MPDWNIYTRKRPLWWLRRRKFRAKQHGATAEEAVRVKRLMAEMDGEDVTRFKWEARPL